MTITRSPGVLYPTPKKAVNLSVREDLVAEARGLGLNLSKLLEDTLDQRLREARAQRWQEENREAIEHHKRRIAEQGMWHKGMTPWY